MIPTWKLERYALGELPPAELEQIRNLLASDDEARAALQALQASDAAILAERPPASFAARLEPSRAPSRGWWLAGGLGVAAAALLVIEPPADPEGLPMPEEVVLAKGLPSLRVYRQGPEVLRLEDGARAAPGDVLQVGYDGHGEPFALLVSVDGTGLVTVHEEGASRDQLLDHSFELDDAPGYERFVLVVDEAPVDRTLVELAVKDAGAAETLALPAHLEWSSVTLYKETP